MLRSSTLQSLLFVALLTGVASPAQALERFAVVVGHNQGDESTRPLKYAEKDARKMGEILTALGGVPESNLQLLLSPDAERLADTLDTVERAVSKGGSETTELIFYYSGHADKEALLLGETRFPLDELSSRMETSGARVRIVIIDACYSGAIVRDKGGKRVPAFTLGLTDDAQTQGVAILTSSSEGERSQESDELRGSFFTHFLASGMRGEADSSLDGTVTLDELYSYAYNRTLKRTWDQGNHRQHPIFDYRIQGSGQVVMTRPDRASSFLVLPVGAEGNYLLYDVDRDVVLTEVDKLPEAEQVIPLRAGRYDVLKRTDEKLSRVRVTVKEGERLVLPAGRMSRVSRDYLIAKGRRGSLVLSAKGGYQFFWDSQIRTRSILPSALGGMELRSRDLLWAGASPYLELLGGAGVGNGEGSALGPLAQSSSCMEASLGVAFRLLSGVVLVEARPAVGLMYLRRKVDLGPQVDPVVDSYWGVIPTGSLTLGHQISRGFSVHLEGKVGYLPFREDGEDRHLGFTEAHLVFSLSL